MMYSLKGLISPRISFVNSRFLLVNAIFTIYFLLGKICSVEFFLEVWLVLGVIWSELSILGCFVPEIFSYPLSSNTQKKMSA